MKAKKILFTSSGILKLIFCGFVLLVVIAILLLSGIIKESFLADTAGLQEIIDELISIDSSYAYLSEYSAEQCVDFIFEFVDVFCILSLIYSLCGIVWGIFNLIFAKKYDTMIRGRLGRKIAFTILSVLLALEIVTTTLTIIAIWLKESSAKSPLVENEKTSEESV